MNTGDISRLLESGEGAQRRARELFEAADSVLTAVATNPCELRVVRHPLGFLCLPVLRDGGTGLCVHVFGNDAAGLAEPPVTSDIHSHSWELTSFILYGEVQNRRMRVTEGDPHPTHRVYDVVTSPSGTDSIRPTDRLVRCEPGHRRTRVRGEVYTLPAGEFHTTFIARGGEAATLVLGRSVPGVPDLSLGPLEGRAHSSERRLGDAATTRETAGAVLRRMCG